MKTTVERLNELFSNPAFLEKNARKSTLDEIFEAVSAEIPEITKAELDDYLTAVSKAMAEGEVTESDLDDVSGGGISAAAVVGVVASVVGSVRGCYAIGHEIGRAIYRWSHR